MYDTLFLLVFLMLYLKERKYRRHSAGSCVNNDQGSEQFRQA
ncbi:MAG TPA: hypothetical protein VM901_11295 [Bdellovibrionota bacterium]|jgi:hypothetical protein|nr:hypothetical protein [Bdellovibrionota bacterium]